MHFDTFYQYFLFSKSWAYIAIICILPLFAFFWNTAIYPTKDKDVHRILGNLAAKLPCCKCKGTAEPSDN
ncbi:MAG: hypothetical protein Q4F72_03910 [Desulfovibrionaceae bacterium]|nr:hypothetical protein [Desulfovibrionaceae bacterium]